LNAISAGGIKRRLRTLFPEREFFMRSQGQVRFIKISSRVQMAAAGIVALLLLAWLITMATVAVSQVFSSRDRIALLDREAKVATAESRVDSYRDNLDAVAADLARRQDFIEKMTEAQLGELPVAAQAGESVSDSRSEASRTVQKVSAVLPEAAGLARIEARQLAFVERLTRLADQRAERASIAIIALGLDPRAMINEIDDRGAQGGPLLRLATAADGSLDPRFRRMGLSLSRMSLLERGLAGIPQVLPASMDYISSGFGYRADPFTGEGALHSGLDFKGPYGAPIYAAAKGTVSFVGEKQGYGKVVEIDHGNGLMTRYAHMSGFRAKTGQPVEAGAHIGAIGSSGRSTGPHLHFEVRVNDRPVNPRPFLESAPHVLEEARSGTVSGGK
jgi:murein DD-endopeptidase MepM/ murein hydrolase activator NlpD